MNEKGVYNECQNLSSTMCTHQYMYKHIHAVLDAVQVNLLCGQCKQGYSLAEGTLHCIQCPKHWPAPVVANILEGIVGDILLVLFFLILNLTVSSFRNCQWDNILCKCCVCKEKPIFAISKHKFLHFLHKRILNTLTVLEKCLYEGMDANVLKCLSLNYIPIVPDCYRDLHLQQLKRTITRRTLSFITQVHVL